MRLRIDKRYLLLPVSPTAADKRLRISVGGELRRDLSLRILADGEYTYSYDMRDFLGCEAELSLAPEVACEFRLSDHPAPLPPGAERYRPAAHFTAPSGWINDPNGLVYYKGLYHLFYQHNPVGNGWGNMHWGHAVSEDLFTWRDLPEALFPDAMGTMFSGSAFVDFENVSGLGSREDPALLLFYTAAGGTSELSAGKRYTQCLAWSRDGLHFTKYEKNPVLPHIAGENRDPKVCACAETGGYVMALYLEGCTYGIYGSEDLLSWQEICRIDLPGDSECPDFHPITAPDGSRLWLLSGAAGKYILGRFDGKCFVPQSPVRSHVGEGNCSYAAQTFSAVPDGRILRLAWDRAKIPNSPFQSAMTAPVELSVAEYGGELWLAAKPIAAFDGRPVAELPAGEVRQAEIELPAGAASISLRARGEEAFELRLFGLCLRVDAKAGELSGGGCRLPLFAEGEISIRILCDRTSTEVWTGDGKGTLCIPHVADPGLCRLEISAPAGLYIEKLTAATLSDREERA